MLFPSDHYYVTSADRAYETGNPERYLMHLHVFALDIFFLKDSRITVVYKMAASGNAHTLTFVVMKAKSYEALHVMLLVYGSPVH
jgi:hypothetical protein